MKPENNLERLLVTMPVGTLLEERLSEGRPRYLASAKVETLSIDLPGVDPPRVKWDGAIRMVFLSATQPGWTYRSALSPAPQDIPPRKDLCAAIAAHAASKVDAKRCDDFARFLLVESRSASRPTFVVAYTERLDAKYSLALISGGPKWRDPARVLGTLDAVALLRLADIGDVADGRAVLMTDEFWGEGHRTGTARSLILVGKDGTLTRDLPVVTQLLEPKGDVVTQRAATVRVSRTASGPVLDVTGAEVVREQNGGKVRSQRTIAERIQWDSRRGGFTSTSGAR